MRAIFLLINCMFVLSAVISLSAGKSLHEKKLTNNMDLEDHDSNQVIRNLLMFIIKNNECFSEEKLTEKLNSIINMSSKQNMKQDGEVEINKRSKFMGKYHELQMPGMEIAAKRKMTVEKKGYDYGTILYIGKRNENEKSIIKAVPESN